MKAALSPRIWDVLACPFCGHPLVESNAGAKCSGCNEDYPRSLEGQLDLRLRRKKLYPIQLEVGADLLPEGGFGFKPLPMNRSPQINFSQMKIPWHLTKELMSHFPRANGNGSLMLDLGCGDAVHKKVCEYAGFEYVGLDYLSPEGQIRGDAQALPFKDDSFEFVLTVSVLQYVRYPFIMMQEVARVLEPGGKFIGTVAFQEPFRDSYYHHTHLGTYNSLAFAGFDIEYIAPSPTWTVLFAHAKMSLFPRIPAPFSRSLVLPLHLLHRFWWKLGYLSTRSKNASENYRLLCTTGAICFIARNKNGVLSD